MLAVLLDLVNDERVKFKSVDPAPEKHRIN